MNYNSPQQTVVAGAPEALEQLEEDPLIVELRPAAAALLLGRDRRGERAVAERELSTGMQLSARLGKAFPDAAAFVLQKQQRGLGQ